MSSLRLKLATYNIHKAVGTDGKRDPDRILAVLHELDADVIALQEVDRRFGDREAVLPRALVEEAHWRIASRPMRPRSMGWHGNAILVRPEIQIIDVKTLDLPRIEPRGAVFAHLRKEDAEFRVAGAHLDLSGLARRRQLRTLCECLNDGGPPSIVAGDFNEWSARAGAPARVGGGWQVLTPGRSFPAGRPIAPLDRFLHDRRWTCAEMRVHHSALATRASDHLPVCAALDLDA